MRITCGVYKIYSGVDVDLSYIGGSSNVHGRWIKHLSELNNHRHHSRLMQEHYDKYGRSVLRLTILFECSESALLSNEQYFLDRLNPKFNTYKSVVGRGHKLNEESRRKMSLALLGNQRMLGKTHSPETRMKISLSNTGKVGSMKGRKFDEEHRRKISESNLGRQWSEESRQNFGKKQVGELNNSAKYSNTLVADIITAFLSGKTRLDIAIIFGLTHAQVAYIISHYYLYKSKH